MQVGIIATDGGPHPAEKVAMACATRLVEISPSLNTGERFMAAMRLQLAIADALIGHHATVQDDTRSELADDAATHFARLDLHDPGERLDQAMADVLKAASGTEWEPLFHEPAKLAELRQVIGQSLVDVAHLERCYHADANPGDAVAAAYKALPSGVAVVNVAED